MLFLGNFEGVISLKSNIIHNSLGTRKFNSSPASSHLKQPRSSLPKEAFGRIRKLSYQNYSNQIHLSLQSFKQNPDRFTAVSLISSAKQDIDEVYNTLTSSNVRPDSAVFGALVNAQMRRS
jgi:hypothetical protein